MNQEPEVLQWPLSDSELSGCRFCSLSKGNILCLNGDSFLGVTCRLGAAKHRFMSYGVIYLMVLEYLEESQSFSAWLANNSEPFYRGATNIALILIFTSTACFAIL